MSPRHLRDEYPCGSQSRGNQSQYDTWANLHRLTTTKGTLPGFDFLANASNQLEDSLDPGYYDYDDAGNLTRVGWEIYTYNAENPLTSTSGVTNTYDGDSRRVKKSNGKLYWYGLTGEVLQETNLSGALLDEYIFFNGKRTARRRQSDGAVFYFFSDHLSSARVVTNATSTIMEESDFYPFGGERVITDTLDNNYKFTSKERDFESGLDYFIARHYSSSIGRFLQIDPGNAGSAPANPQDRKAYAYTSSTPWSWWMHSDCHAQACRRSFA